MNFSFENQGANTYLVYSVGAEDVIDTMSLGMLTNNRIPGLASVQFTQMDTTKYIKYNVSAHVSVKQFFTGAVNKKRLVGVFKGIVDAMIAAEDYMIDPNSILLDLDYIFADVSTCETVLICLPVAELENTKVDLGAFFKNIVFSTQFDQTENCDYVAKIINYLNSTPVFSLYDFEAILNSIDNPAGVQAQQNIQPSSPTPVAPKPAPQPAVAPVQQPVVTASPQTPQPAPQAAPVAPQPHAVPNDMGKKPVNNQVVSPKMPPKPAPAPVQPQSDPNEPKMSMFYLLQHYNKENAAIYKAQKQAKKAQAATAAPKQSAVPPAQKVNPAFNKAAPAPQNALVAPVRNTGFAVPGQAQPSPAPNMGFAVPGQAQPSPAPNMGFAVPGQSAPAQKPAQATVSMPQQTQPTPPPQPTYQAPQMPQGQSMNFGETTVLGGSSAIGETTVLGATSTAVQPKPHFIRTKNNEKIDINKPVFRIGKEKSYVDYFIGDNAAISRSHANIISRDGEYYVQDTNSTNHTYVNGNMIQSNVEFKLSSGDRVRLANEEFEFRMF